MQMLKRGIAAVGLTGLVVGLVVACGGGGANFAGIDRLGVTTGTINGFGSIIVNGIHYEDDGDCQTAFDIDDSGTGSQPDLQVGQQVAIEWSSSDDGVTRCADNVSYDDTLEGPIAAGSIDPVNQSFVVLGQTVLVDAATSFDDDISPRDLTGLADGDFVEVSGLLDGNGAVRATRIESVSAVDDGLEVRGVIESLDTINKTFVISGLIVDYSQVLNPPVLANDQFVEVEGEDFDSGTGTLIADKVELEDDHISGSDDGDDGEVEGYVTRFISATDFDVAGVPVTTVDGQTVYEDGVVGDLALNVKVEIEGEVNASGVIVARKVEFKSDDDGDDDSIDGRVEADVTGTPGATTFSLAGVTVTVTATTRFEDHTGVADQTFGLDDISAGDYVEVRGTPGVGATLTAVIVERDDDGNGNLEGLLRGPASLVANPNLSVLGVPVITDGSTEFRDADDVAFPNAAAFFAALTADSEVQVQFTQTGGAIVADEIELEEDDD
jgi:hypothetical protein